MASKSRILVVGSTGYIGKFIVEASAKAGHPTFALVRDSALSDPAKSQIIQSFKNIGVIIVSGDLFDHESLVKAIKEVDVVISTVGLNQLSDQDKLISAIKEAGNVKRFFSSEFGFDVENVHGIGPVKSIFEAKVKIRRAVEAEGIPYTYVLSYYFNGFCLPRLAQHGATAPPRDKVVIQGDGNPKVIFNKEEDIATYTIKAVDDPTTLNKILYIKPPQNVLSINELVALWENKIAKTLHKTYISEDQLLKNIQEATYPLNLMLAFDYSIFVKGDHKANQEIEASVGLEATKLYPEVKYTTVDQYLNQFV
ncbi:phenylcoumaran benzylic ether reductase Pyrc5-like [Benincasa hispida]|uniref:phenylcoumaran benzylic ether reductase Pyrc5-like n=1 Tax=Benincasa hispida TaxID=102211 RepID=UPI0018FF14C5|nr:phenylcoumaran benzylic ether reductase Pyrc5-like [Benincasa hispida]